MGDGDRAFRLLQMLNPLTHASTPADADRYKVEPYAVCADVYNAEGHVGRGGWTWYTGSASWSYRVALEGLLGFTKRGERLSIAPCIPPSWKEFNLDYRGGSATYDITVRNPHGVSTGASSVVVDGAPVRDGAIRLVDDGVRHVVMVTLERA
jgi:cyclic beta-1,2-glucan synthetase